MLKQFIVVMLSICIMHAATTSSYAAPDAAKVYGDLRLFNSGSIVFSDGSVQSKAIDANSYYTKAEIDELMKSVTTLISLQPVSGLMATVNDTSIMLSWKPMSNATSYNIYWGPNAGITTSSQKISSISNTYYELSNLTRGVTYFFAVSPNYVTGEGSLSPEISKQVSTVQTNLIREFEPNNDINTANIISIGGGTFRGQLSTKIISCTTNRGDHDYYSFNSVGGIVQFSVIAENPTTFATGIIKASITSQDGNTILSSTTINDSMTSETKLIANTIPGTYHLVISPNYTCYDSGNGSASEIFTKDYIVTPTYVY